MNWNDIIGHRRQVEVLRSVTARRRSAHAYLFAGEASVGKRTVAEVTARALLCEAAGGAERPCNACRSCRRALSDHPDYFSITPSGTSIKIEQIRDIQRELAFRPAWQQHKVICINLADDMTEQAQNALLKSLEEPPAFATFILLSESTQAVLPTIQSRCVPVRFGRVAERDIAAALVAKGYEPQRAKALAAISFGRPGMVFAAETEELVAQRERVLDWGKDLLRRPTAVWFVGEALERERQDAARYIDMLMLWLRDLLLIRTGHIEAIVNQDRQDELVHYARKASPQGLLQAMRALLQLKQDWESNANFRLALDVALISIQRGLQSA